MAKGKQQGSGPLSGRRVVVTRPKGQAQVLVKALEKAGAEVLRMPLIEIGPVANEEAKHAVFSELWQFNWIIFTSANGVRFFFEEFFTRFEDIRSLGLVRFAVVGPATATALSRYHLKIDVMPDKSDAESLAKALEEFETIHSLRILIIEGNRNREALVERLEAAQAIIQRLQVYENRPVDLATSTSAMQFRSEGADAIIFASGSAVEVFRQQAGQLQLVEGARHPIPVSWGPTTSAAMRERGLAPVVEAAETTEAAVVAALKAHFAG